MPCDVAIIGGGPARSDGWTDRYQRSVIVCGFLLRTI
jgi:hypothetical protein